MVFGCLVVFLFCIVAILLVQHLGSDKNVQSALLLYNIEALADDEHVAITQCFGKGSVDCPKSHRKVEYVFGGYSLEGLY